MRSLLLLVVLALVAISQVSCGVVYQRSVVPSGWSMMGVSSPSSQVSFTLGLRTMNDDKLDAHLMAVSDPSSDDYQEFLTTTEINAIYGASEDDVQAVKIWLMQNGVRQLKIVHGAIRVVTTAAIASKLFQTEMRVFKHIETGKEAVKAWGKYSLPDQIHKRVEIVTGISAFPVPNKNPFKVPKPDQHTAVIQAPDATEIILPETIHAMYHIRQQMPGSHPESSQGVIEYEGQYFSNKDLQTFATAVGFTMKNNTVSNVSAAHTVGTNNQNAPQVESSLDIQWIATINLEATNWFWIEDGTGWLYEFGTHMLNYTMPPQVTSTSYGWWEGDQCAIDGTECQTLGVDGYGYAAAVNKLFAKIGMAGTSLIVASGDSGANGRTDEGCSMPNLRPEFPAASPYVTTVGATQVVNATYTPSYAPICAGTTYSCVAGGREVAVSLSIAGFTSGGGFSNVSGATRPSWQDDAVTAYFNSGVQFPPASMWNRMGRGEPDVAANGHNGLIVVGGRSEPVGGTSMSSPIFAGVISFLNTISLSKTGKSLGFLNPFLYSMQAAQPNTFLDITEGDNICPESGCGGTPTKCRGYTATKGWDAVTGLGTPRVDNMESYLNGMLDKVIARKAARKAATTKTA